MRRMLLTKLRRAAMAHPEFAADHEKQAALRLQIEGIIARHKVSGALNDKAFAEMKVASLRRAGRSRRAIRQKLAQKGIAASVISQTLEGHAQDTASEDGAESADAEAERRAALAFVRKRRLGPFRTRRAGAGTQEDGKDSGYLAAGQRTKTAREAGAMVRAGFSPALATQILGLSPDDLEEDL